MPARSVCLVALSLSEAGPGRFGRQASAIDIYHTMPWHGMALRSVQLSSVHGCATVDATVRISRFTNGIYWEAGLFLRTPFTEGCDGVNYQTLPPGRSNMLYF